MTQFSKSVEVQITTPTGTLYGTQIMPTSNASEPVVLIVAGSGPTDRNGNNPLAGQNNSLKLLAEGLADRGIASIRYDKRGIGESSAAGSEEADLRFDTYVEDAALWIQQLQADSRFSSVTAIGHSEGSLIGMLATRKTGADAFVSVAGIARTASQVLREQLQPRLPDALWQQSEQILVALEQGNTVASVPPELNTLYRSSVQPYLISWFRYTPAQEIKRLTVPVLIVQGTTDIQVPVSEAQALKIANPDAELRIIEGMNHVLKAVPLDPKQQNASYSEPTLPVVPELVEGISQFIHSRGMLRKSNQSLHRNLPS
ncbi:alpha/beta fold hydrolase [Chamaesiphon sp. OTE_75_metabat_556]|uniref:alpha/beta hydrolase n=1 Tax=Chamaesiphon sp. OTE_75_metabat_556 TaxID=2964692 RepID=UPI00286BAAA9|nr:alpha/beta fold hydrolase [Chamaesiphon sp. OTE_75_metabat_556]